MIDEIQTLIDTYQPSDASVELFRSVRIVLLVGIAGAGKNTIQSQLVERPEFVEIITSTTRQPRANNGVLEQDGVEYHFISHEQALDYLRQGDYVEASLVHGEQVYGVTAAEIERIAASDRIAVADVDIQGVVKYKQLSDQISAIFLLPPNYATWRERMRTRYATDEEFEREWPTRRASAIAELEEALRQPYYHFVINDDLAEAVDACVSIVEADETFHRKDDEKRLVARDILDELRVNP